MDTAQSPQESKSPAALREEAILEFWKKETVFDKTLEKESPMGEFVFYEGPPTANGKPGIHHLEARAFKDAVPRYKTMRGYHVRRKGGWDTHGLPVELQVEKELGLNSKKAIEEYGIAHFNEKCKESVWQFLGIWEKFTDRIGYWVDQKNPYVTYHNSYIESLWNVVKTVDEKELLYKDYKVVPWCPRCGTALSSHELAQGYQDDKDLSVTAKFKITGEDNTFVLAWTTTPWTLPGNVALAVGENIEYVKVKKGDEYYILAEARLSVLEGEYEIVEKMKGSALMGKSYEPLYSYLAEKLTALSEQKERLEKAFKIYGADFVTTEDGTGVVHTAVMYGADDFELGTKLDLPKFHMVTPDGVFIPDAGFLSGRFVKDEEVAIDIIKDLAHRGLLFKKEKYEHSYPHCWRCKTPLIYYARDSWYIRMSKPEIKNALIEENQKIHWEPGYIQNGRFGEWLKDLKDWAISRERYWGTPLPIWVTASGKKEVIGSLAELKSKTKKSGNAYFVMRHGGSQMNAAGICSYAHQAEDHLTDEGKKQVVTSALALKEQNIDLIISSPFERTKETALLAAQTIGLSAESVIFDERLREVDPGEYDGQTWDKYHDYLYESGQNWFDVTIPGGESLKDVYKRTAAVIYELEATHVGKNILIVTHGGPAWLLFVSANMHEPHEKKYHKDDSKNVFVDDFKRFDNAEVRPLPFIPVPHNENYELDVHRPYIDAVTLISRDGEEMTRVKEVMDVWFDSGAMPFAQDNYPFATKDIAFPADFICEAIDQTRGWFYTLHAVGTLMGRGRAYNNVICLGHILDGEGKKMSKSLGNIVDPWVMMDTYGVDTLRLWMYSVNQPGESKNFDEKTVAELHNKVFNLLYNVLSFYELYRDRSIENTDSGNTRDANTSESSHVLDQWILIRLDTLTEYMTENLDAYKLLEPVRAVREFIDDLSTWYVRRSRDRMKEGDVNAKRTLYRVLKTVAQLMAPFAPFAAEDIWQTLKADTDVASVHLSSWPESSQKNKETQTSEGGKANEENKAGATDPSGVITTMALLRETVTMGLKARQSAGFPVRQPLARITIIGGEMDSEYSEILKDELNVKDVAFEKGEVLSVALDTTITPELQREGEYRELVRAVQDMRKKQGLTPSDTIALTLPDYLKEAMTPFVEALQKSVLAESVQFSGDQIVVSKK